MRATVLGFLVSATLLAGCASAPNLAPPPPPPPAALNPVKAAVQTWPNPNDVVIGRSYLYPGEVYAPTKPGLPFGVILLRNGDAARNQALCQSFVQNITPTEEWSDIDPNLDVVATYWMLRTAAPADSSRLADCNYLLANYDFGRAQQVRQGYGKVGATGPVFLTLKLNAGAPADVLMLDLSQKSASEVALITANWFQAAYDQTESELANTVAIPANDNRPWWKKLIKDALDIAASMGAAFFCEVASGNAANTGVSVFKDPFLPSVSGHMRTFVHGNVFLSFAASTMAKLAGCPNASHQAAPASLLLAARPVEDGCAA